MWLASQPVRERTCFLGGEFFFLRRVGGSGGVGRGPAAIGAGLHGRGARRGGCVLYVYFVHFLGGKATRTPMGAAVPRRGWARAGHVGSDARDARRGAAGPPPPGEPPWVWSRARPAAAGRPPPGWPAPGGRWRRLSLLPSSRRGGGGARSSPPGAAPPPLLPPPTPPGRHSWSVTVGGNPPSLRRVGW